MWSVVVWCRKDVRLPVQLQRAMAAEAEATREARAKVGTFTLNVATLRTVHITHLNSSDGRCSIAMVVSCLSVSLWACRSVCMRTYLGNHTCQLHPNFTACYL